MPSNAVKLIGLDASERRFEGWSFLSTLAPSFLFVMLYVFWALSLSPREESSPAPAIYTIAALAFFVGVAWARPWLVLPGPFVFALFWAGLAWLDIPSLYTNAGRQWDSAFETFEISPLLLLGAALAVPIFSQPGRGRAIVSMSLFVVLAAYWTLMRLSPVGLRLLPLEDEPSIATLVLSFCLALFGLLLVTRRWRWFNLAFALGMPAIAAGVVAAQFILPLPKQPSYVPLIFLGCGATLCGRFVADTLQVIGTTPRERQLVRPGIAGRSGFGALAIRAVGIHPIWRFMPRLWQKVLVGVLFALSTLALTILVYMLTVHIWRMAPQQFEWAWAICLRAHTSEDYGACHTGTVLAPLAYPIVLSPLVLVAGLCRYAARRLARLSLEKLVATDQRPPILFLRSFRDDQVKLKRPKRMLWRRLLTVGEPRPTLDHILFEEGTPYGPVVAIGAPGGAAPFGAARAFVHDDVWQQRVLEIARNARAIVIALDDTDGVRWEFDNIALAYPAKTLCMLPLSFAAAGERRRRIADLMQTSPNWAAVADEIRSNPSSCVAWHSAANGGTELMTTKVPSSVSYILAVRSFLLVLTEPPEAVDRAA